MNGRKRATSGLMVAIAAVLAMVVGVNPAFGTPRGDGGTRVCGKTESTPVAGGRYEAQNNLWGADTPQCITAFDTGFVVDPADHRNEDGPASYPSMVWGCNYGNCTKDTPFPKKVSELAGLRSSWTVEVPPTGDYNVSYDLWMDPTPRRTGRPTGLELMVWLKNTPRVQPIGEKKAEVEIGGTTWDVWLGSIDLPTISYVRQEPTLSVTDLPLDQFVADAQRRGVAKPEWWMTSVQAGFEPWIGGRGLATRSFSADIGTPVPAP
ncbi:GH12 family glycosyl hydrolase domain-containing protein [Actinomycetospora aeridis]|uniref:Glycosyl hydrolase family 12 n=1 Tax=Actinomycetospora aeridis TaxID=3129231 RepID=A0ABU8NEF2_9PSEU